MINYLKSALIISIILLITNIFLLAEPEGVKKWKELKDSTSYYFEKYDLQTALKWAELSEKKAREVFGEMDTNYVVSLGKIAEIYTYLRETDSINFYSNKFYSLCREIYKYDHPQLALSIRFIAEYYYLADSLAKSEQLFVETLAMFRRIYKSPNQELFGAVSRLSFFYYQTVDMHKAIEFSKEALDIARKISKPDDNQLLASATNNLAVMYLVNGDFMKAEPLYKESLEIARRKYKTDNPELTSSLLNVANYYERIGDYAEAEKLLSECLEMSRRLFNDNKKELIQVVFSMANLYYSMGDYTKAEPLFLEALDYNRKFLKPGNLNIAGTLRMLACLYDITGNFAKAEPLYKEALGMYEKTMGPDETRAGAGISWIAGIYSALGNYPKAEEYFNKAIEIYKRLYYTEHPGAIAAVSRIASLYYTMKDFAKAEPQFKSVLELYKKMFEKYSIYLSEKEKEKFWNTMQNTYEEFYSFVLNRYKDNPSILSFAYDNLIFTKALQFNYANRIKRRIMESKDSLLISRFKEYSKKKETLVKLYSLPAVELARQGYNIDSLEKISNDLEKELSLKSESFKQSYEMKKVSWRSIQTLLKPDEAAIEMVRFRLKGRKKFTDTIYYAAFIVTDQTTENPEIVIFPNGNELEDLFYNKYRNNVKMKSNDNESFGAFWQKIYEKTKTYRKIFFSPDGIFNKLNIGTFQVESGKFLLDFQEIHQLNSTQDILLGYYSKEKETNVYNSAVLIGNPDFTLSYNKVREKEQAILSQVDTDERGATPTRSFVLSALPGTEKEVDNIAKYLKSKNWVVSKQTKADAIKAIVKTVSNPRVLHIATHGLFLSDIKPTDDDIFGINSKRILSNPLLRSGLFFAGATSTTDANFRPSGYDNGFLTAYEAQNLNLDKTELVVLSACETGLGEIKNGEGVYGLQRAFIQAGAKSIIMSLWSVSDEATQELMSTFYKEWLDGRTKREAFRTAQMKLKEKFGSPYYWGAFVMVGE